MMAPSPECDVCKWRQYLQTCLGVNDICVGWVYGWVIVWLAGDSIITMIRKTTWGFPTKYFRTQNSV